MAWANFGTTGNGLEQPALRHTALRHGGGPLASERQHRTAHGLRQGRPSAAGQRRTAPRPKQTCELQNAIDALQGTWCDDIGLRIEISGREARFSDGTGTWTFEEADGGGALVLRGARLIGQAAAPLWQFPTGVQRYWARTEPAGAGDTAWAEAFLRYKERRLQLRQQLRDAFAGQDLDRAMQLKLEWQSPGAANAALTPAQNAALATGCWLVPGACFWHKKFEYRGVVLGFDPWCTYPAAWRARWVPNRPRGEAQPFYHCLVDERDRPGGQTRYVAEENMEPSDFIYPVHADLADMLLVRCDELGGYLPGPRLDEALRKQRAGGGFRL